MGDKPISFRDADGNFVSAADVWNEKKLEELFNMGVINLQSIREAYKEVNERD